MAILKCKICGGDMEITADKSFGICEYCGSTMTLPKIDDEQRADAFNRGNHFRRIGEFDKALQVYERIVTENPNDAEAHWCCALCRFGIEWVEDPTTMEYLPTCHRASFDIFTEDVDYISALNLSDGLTQKQYKKDGMKIAEVQRGILATSQNEKPFDIFICYKESDESGNRTVDSTLAQDIYYQLTDQGLRVFFSRITLEDKAGSEYEPYIFAALNSAKVMVVVGTKPEHFNAIWVKNEWSRFLSIVKHDRSKIILPCYKNMNPYDLPEQLSVLQSYDMSKIGFIQDLIRGIKKITDMETPIVIERKNETVIVNNSTNIEPLLKRAFMFLEDGEFERADEFCEQVLNQDPECAEAYLGKLMAELNVRKREQLADCAEPFDTNNNFQKAVRFGDEKLQAELKSAIKKIVERNEENRLRELYYKAVRAMDTANSEDEYKAASRAFQPIQGFKDADALAEKCLEKAEISRKDAIYNSAKSKMDEEKIISYEEAIKDFQIISGWKDADEQIAVCYEKIEAKKESDRLDAVRLEEEKRITFKKLKILTAIVAVVIVLIIVLNTVIIPTAKYNKAVEKYGQEWADTVKNASVGDTIVFGTYEQDNNTSNGKEAIEWTVLDKDGMSLLLVSKQALDCKQYNTSYTDVTWESTDVTWESCSLRKWMNGTFLNNAFSVAEQAQIQSTTVSAHKNPNYSTNPGNATTDKVFLLSITEAEKYFSSDEDRKCVPTEYAIAQGAYTSSSYTKGGAATCWWWLRSPGSGQGNAAGVFRGGSVNYSGRSVCSGNDCVRPALWINLDS